MNVSYWKKSLAAPALALALMAGMAHAQEDIMRPRPETRGSVHLITVSGQGEIRLKPDLVTLSLGIEERGPDVAGPRDRAAEKAQAAIKALKDAGVKPDDIQTSRYSVSREWIAPPPGVTNEPTKYEFVVRNTVSVRTGLVNKAGDLLDAVIKAGFNDVSGPDFGMKDDSAARRQALVEAMKDARAKADALAAVSGVTVSGVESITESGAVAPPEQPMAFRSVAMAKAPMSTPIESGEVVVTANVNASFRF